MNDSILLTIKDMLGADYDHFNSEIIVHINSVLFTLTQIGVGPSDGFFITGESEKWSDFIGEIKTIEAIKSLIYLKVKLIFDPPQNSFLVEAMERQAAEFEWRLNVQVDKQIPIVEEVVIDG